GAIVRGGGKVVKNVAGYDLPKLFVGSYGTLGVIVEATVKLRPLPEHEQLLCIPFDRLKDAGAAVKALLAGDLIPNAIELLDAAPAAAAAALGAEGPGAWVGFEGPREQVDGQCAGRPRRPAWGGGRGGGPLPDAGPRLERGARAAFPAATAFMAFSVLPSQVA